MADRFPSLEDFDSGGKFSAGHLCLWGEPILTCLVAQTDIKDASDSPSASNFLEREKAVLGDDANQFATVEDAGFDDGDDDLLGGGGGGVSSPGNNAAFETQFPDITSPNEVCEGDSPSWDWAGSNSADHRASHPAVPSRALQSVTTRATSPTQRRRRSPR